MGTEKHLKQWHTVEVSDVLSDLKTQEKGLTRDEAARRLEDYGKNELAAEEKASLLSILASQFINVLIIVLLVSATISLILGKQVESISIFIIVILAAVLGTLQEFQAGKALEALRRMASPSATVIRDGETTEIPASDLVPGDIVVVNYGNKVPADIRIIESNNLQVEEAALTGESLAVEKMTAAIEGDNVPLGDRKNLLFMGTSISHGRGKGIVVGTGANTEFGKIASLLQNTKTEQTPLQKNLDKLGSQIGIIAIVVALALSTFSYIFNGGTILDAFIWAVALAVAIIPEALPAVVTIGLALGVKRMVKRQALIRKLPAVETLGAVNVICTDKTGTLTKDEMTIRKVFADSLVFDVDGSGYSPEGAVKHKGSKVTHVDNAILSKVLTYGILCSDAELKLTEEGWDVLGDPTEGAIVTAAKKAHIDTIAVERNNPRVEEIPFSSDKKYMATAHKTDAGKLIVLKGAFEVILGKCSKVDTSAGAVTITSDIETNILKVTDEFASQALRVIAVAYSFVADDVALDESILKDLTLAGFVAMIDPPREEVKPAIATCKKAGIRTIMITGDHKATAFAIAKELKIADRDSQVYSGVEVANMSQSELDKAVNEASVFARIAPEHKLRIVESLMNQGNVAAMTGDGVNDAPALKKANIGVAMGITGTDVSKEAADMILTDDNFVTIVSAVEEGRTIFENIKKFLIFLLSGNAGTVFALMLAFAFGLELPMTPVQILFINFIMDGLIAIAISLEPTEAGIMGRKPRKVAEGIISGKGLLRIMTLGVVIAIVTFGVYYFAHKVYGLGLVESQTLFFLTLIFARLFNSLNNRSLNASAFTMNPLTNKPLIVSSIIGMLVVWTTTAVPVLQTAFGNTYINLQGWLVAAAAGAVVLIFGELFKLLNKNKI
ncbi:cation-translocating P-type ATPase [Alistipes sp. ZOR0009]|uniref:cation-translocating P-type ATPase n=1 Tax=Alistipes sp. ZOR0009 TaxID=1339253 RepID=UPI000647C751|nr:cation-translocating P-type ATPase [Alistipes sp. ZOR0009]